MLEFGHLLLIAIKFSMILEHIFHRHMVWTRFSSQTFRRFIDGGLHRKSKKDDA
jgi:hypothetical protein